MVEHGGKWLNFLKKKTSMREITVDPSKIAELHVSPPPDDETRLNKMIAEALPQTTLNKIPRKTLRGRRK
jgi:hypothetical protein